MKRQKENKLHGFVSNSMKTALSTYRKIENTDTQKRLNKDTKKNVVTEEISDCDPFMWCQADYINKIKTKLLRFNFI